MQATLERPSSAGKTSHPETAAPAVSAKNSAPASVADREVRFEHSANLASLLDSINASVIVSTYQAGKLVVVGSHQERVTQSFHNFDRPMGVAIHNDSMAVASRDRVWFLSSAPEIAPEMPPRGTFDACYLTRRAQLTGEVQAHEIGWADDELWIVNTAFSCLCTLDDRYNFVPRWKPRFISQLAPEDRCHLNGMAIENGQLKYVSAMSETDVKGGWRPNKVTSGCLIDVASEETVARGLAMPHSPRVHNGAVYLLDSGRGELVTVDVETGSWDTVARLPGYTRGLDFVGDYAVIGLSKIRETSTFGGVPIAEKRDELRCGFAVVDLRSGRTVSRYEFQSGVDEIFAITAVQESRTVSLRGPYLEQDGYGAVWRIPTSGLALNSSRHA